MVEEPPIVVGVSGASGTPIALRVLRVPVALVVSEGARGVLREECGLELDALRPLAGRLYADDDFSAPIATGSRRSA